MIKSPTLRAKALWAAAFAAPGLLAAAPAMAQAVAVVDPQGAVVNTKAFQAATTQIRTQYKAQIDQASTRSQAIQAELQPMITSFNTARSQPNANQATLQTQAQAIQAKEQAGQQEIDTITLPAKRAQAYAAEQVQAKLGDAVQNVMRARNVSLIVSPQAVLTAQPAADLTPAITTELDRLVPSVSTAVPANWQPGQQQGAAGVPAATTAPATTPSRPSRGGR